MGAAIQGAGAAGMVANDAAGAARFGARGTLTCRFGAGAHRIHDRLYAQCRALGADPAIAAAMLSPSNAPRPGAGDDPSPG